MSAEFMPLCGRAAGALSTFTTSAGRPAMNGSDTSTPVSGYTGGAGTVVVVVVISVVLVVGAAVVVGASVVVAAAAVVDVVDAIAVAASTDTSPSLHAAANRTNTMLAAATVRCGAVRPAATARSERVDVWCDV